MSLTWVVKHLDIVEHITARLGPSRIEPTFDPLLLEQLNLQGIWTTQQHHILKGGDRGSDQQLTSGFIPTDSMRLDVLHAKNAQSGCTFREPEQQLYHQGHSTRDALAVDEFAQLKMTLSILNPDLASFLLNKPLRCIWK